jgi:hypothetical protein
MSSNWDDDDDVDDDSEDFENGIDELTDSDLADVDDDDDAWRD